jgi:lysyl-tRNA synthetase class 2
MNLKKFDEDDDELPLTRANVEIVLDEMRPFLKADGYITYLYTFYLHFNCDDNSGNVRLAEIDGPVVKLELEGACGSCPSSSMTMKMGLERKLKERIPEIL